MSCNWNFLCCTIDAARNTSKFQSEKQPHSWDQMSAALREDLKEVGVDVYDEHTLFAMLSVLDTAFITLDSMLELDTLDRDTFKSIEKFLCFISGLHYGYLPESAREVKHDEPPANELD